MVARGNSVTPTDKRGARIQRSGLRAWPLDVPFRWFVESETDPEHPHLVDLTSYGMNGECSCKHFVCRMAVELKMGRRASDATRCKHIQAARREFTDYGLTMLMEEKRRAAAQNAAKSHANG